MQNKTAIWVFTIALAFSSLYQLSFSYFTNSFESKAKEYAISEVANRIEGDQTYSMGVEEATDYFDTKYRRTNGNNPIYPLLGYSYNECKDKELKKGLDLAGGMSVTLEVSVPELVQNLASQGNSERFKKALDLAKQKQLNSNGSFVDLFAESWKEVNPDVSLAKAFSGKDNKALFPLNSTDAEIIETLKAETKTAISNTEEILRTRIDRYGVTQPSITKQQFTDRILVELPGVKDKERIRDLLTGMANLEFWDVYNNQEKIGNKVMIEILAEADKKLSLALYPDAQKKVDTSNVENVANFTINENGDTTYVDEDEDEVEQLSQEELSKQNPILSLLIPNIDPTTGGIIPASTIGTAAAEDTDKIDEYLASDIVQNLLPLGGKVKFAWDAKPDQNGRLGLYALKVVTKNGKAKLDGSYIIDARQDYEQYTNQALVNMQMNGEGAKIWKKMTKEAASQNPKGFVAILLDGAVQSAPVVQNEIPRGNSQITMGSQDGNSINEAVDLANLLKAGAMPAPSRIVDEQVVGPTLGADNIRKAMIAFAIAFLMVLLYMIFYYGKAGMVANIALIANIFFLLGALASLHASLTLPGIAGIILTIGMAVDANVLIFERVKEEMRAGAGVRAAVNKGYSKAYSAIIDANITTLLTAIVLFVFGSGPIKGFATTLIVGILTSLFSAIFITRLIITGMLEKGKDVSFFNKMTENWMVKSNIQFVKKRKMFYILSALLILGGIGSLMTRSLDYGVDFAGGRTYNVTFDKNVSIDEVSDALSDVFVDDKGNKMKPQVKSLGTVGNTVKITTKFLINDKSPDADQRVDDALFGGLAKVGTVDMDMFESQKVDPTISDDFQASSMKSVFIALIIIFLYIMLRFRKWQFGLGALVALAHDVLLVLGIYSIFWGRLPFTMEIDQAFIAAILTVVGYSINDTVVVFDRIREFLTESRKGDSKEIVNRALNSTISRTLNTSLTTFLVLFIIFIFGSESIKGFTFALMVGVVVGTYSSLFIATPLVVDLSGESLRKDMRAKK